MYDADVVFDLAGRSLSARWRLDFVADTLTYREAAFLIAPEITVHEVTGPAVRAFRMEPPEDEWSPPTVVVSFDGSVAPGARVTVEMRYAGRPRFGENRINEISTDWVELNLDGAWHPVLSTSIQHLLGTARLSLPADWSVVSSAEVAHGQSRHVLHGRLPQVDLAFIASPAMRVEAGELFSVYYREADPRAVSAVLRIADACGGWLNERFGERDALEAGRIVLADRDEIGYARGNYIVLSRVNPDATTPLTRFICHELAHYWSTSADFLSPNHWMSEAFAEYVSGMFVRDRLGDAEFAPVLQQWETVGRGHGPVWTPAGTARPNAFVMYRRAPFLLHLLEERIGRARFDRFLARFMVEGARTTEALLGYLRDVAGAEAERWFREELARPPAASP